MRFHKNTAFAFYGSRPSSSQEHPKMQIKTTVSDLIFDNVFQLIAQFKINWIIMK